MNDSVNHAFIVDQARKLAGNDAALLDFGCGRGELVALARRQGWRAGGCDWYAGPWASMFDDVARNPELHDHIKRIEPDGRLPFADASFDVVTSNQVFEHIAGREKPLAEIARVLRPGGRLIALFPGREVWHEPHVRLPFAHRFAPGSAAQRRYLSWAYSLGLGWRDARLSREAWIERSIVMLRDECFYPRPAEAEAPFTRHFTLERRGEVDWLRHRIGHHRALRLAAPFIRWRVFDLPLGYLARRLAGQVLILRRR